jgi:spore germination cell wall hydrolase CwlJ-like protein
MVRRMAYTKINPFNNFLGAVFLRHKRCTENFGLQRNESTAGQIAVTQVVFNRVKSTRFPSTSCDVIQQGKHVNGFPVLNRCQFSWYCDGRGDIPHNMKAFEKSQKLAELLFFSKDWLPDLTDGSLWYHADYVSPKWSFTRKKTLTIDTHIFYK